MLDIPSLATRLRPIPTTTACDILKDHGLAERAAVGLVPMTPEPTMAGPGRMVEFLPVCPEIRRPGPPANFALVDAVQPGEVLVFCAGGSMCGAVLDDMLTTRAQMLGANGAVVDGAVRDLEGLAQAGLPAQARGAAPMAAHSTLIAFPCDRPVCFSGVTVMPGDWILADRDGVLFLPLDLAHLVLAAHEGAIARDAFSRELLLLGFALTDVFPLPSSLAGFVDAFRQRGAVPAANAVRDALAKGYVQ